MAHSLKKDLSEHSERSYLYDSIGGLSQTEAELGAAAVASGCPACMLQLSDMLSQNEDAVQVKHPVEIYAEMLPN